MDSLNRFVVYRKSVQFLALATAIIQGFPKGNAVLVDQFRRCSLSIPLNIAEGAGKRTLQDRQRYFSIARGSSFEAYAVLDACEVMGLVDTESVAQGRALLREIVAILATPTCPAGLSHYAGLCGTSRWASKLKFTSKLQRSSTAKPF